MPKPASASVSVSVSVSAMLTATLLLAAAGAARAQERFTLTGNDVAIYNLAGALHITAGSGSATEVEVTRAGRDARELRIVTGSLRGASTLRVIYPRDEVAYPGRPGYSSSTTLRVADDGTFGHGIDGRRVRITSSNRAGRAALEAGADITVRVPEGVRLLARLGVGQAEVRNVNGTITVDNSAGSIHARGVRGELNLNTASGSIELSDVEGGVTVNTASGSVRMDNVRGSAVAVEVASGSITADGVRAPNVALQTASGRIRARAVEASNTRLHTASGSIDAELGGAVRVADVHTASGSVNVALPGDLDAQLDIQTASGDIDVDFPIKVTQQRRGHLRATMGAGTNRVSISTASGGIRLRTL